MKMPQFIVCAAIRRGDIVICGPRHGDCINTANQFGFSTDVVWECGFVDQDNNFLTREEAWVVADARKQIRNKYAFGNEYAPRTETVGDAAPLFSEHLY